jgi:hypothetical protein
VACHGELGWMKLGCFDMDRMASCVCHVDEIEYSLGYNVAYCRGMTMYEKFDPGGRGHSQR